MVHTRAQQIKLEVIKRVCRLPFKKGHKSMVSAVYQVIFTKVILTKFLPPKIARTEMRAIFAPNLLENIPRAVRFSQIFRSFVLERYLLINYIQNLEQYRTCECCSGYGGMRYVLNYRLQRVHTCNKIQDG